MGGSSGTGSTTTAGSGTPPPAAGTPSEAQREADAAAKEETWAEMADRIDKENPDWGWLVSWFLRFLGMMLDPETPRTLDQEITDVTTKLGVRGKSGALQDNTLTDKEKNELKAEILQVRTKVQGTLSAADKEKISGMLSTLSSGGVEDTDTILGPPIAELRTAAQINR